VLPLTIGTPARFRELRTFLTDINYSEPAVCARLGLKNAQEFLTLKPDPASTRPIRDPLGLAASLFLVGDIVPGAAMSAWAPDSVVTAMTELGLIARYPGRPGDWYATAALYPAYGLFITSDRWSSPEDAPIETAADVVYPAITVNTSHFLESLPEDPCENFLDLCSGSGVAAFVAASRYARQAWATDITEAATLTAEFNRMLNGIENARVARGDLYQAIDGQTFDRIGANPPYMPSLKPAEVYAYGGILGDQITRRIIEGLPKYLRPGGRFYCVTAAPDTEGEGFENRLRGWLGEAGREFDIFVFERRLFDPAYIANQQAARTRGGPDEVDEWKKLFEKHRVSHLFYGSVLIQRKLAPGTPATIRRRKGRRIGTAEIEWLRRWETEAAQPEIAGRILEAKPSAAPGLELHVVHRMRDRELAPQRFSLETNYPFEVQCAIEPWAAFLISRCDGKTTGRELLAFLKENDLIRSDEPEEEFADFLRILISGGFLEIEGFRLPPK